MANVNLFFLGVLLVSAGASIGLMVLLLFQHEFTVHRRPSFIIGYVFFFVALCALGKGGTWALIVSACVATSVYALGLSMRSVLSGNSRSSRADGLAEMHVSRRRWLPTGLEFVKLIAFIAVLLALSAAARHHKRGHVPEQESSSPFENISNSVGSK